MRWLIAEASFPAMRYLLFALLFAISPAYAQDSSATPAEPPVESPAVTDTLPADPDAVSAPETVVFGGPESLTVEVGETVHTFTVEIAETPGQLARGLMYREALAPDAGMIFHYQPAQVVSMWMENTLIPLDMVYIAEDGRVMKVTAHAQPESRRSLGSDFIVSAVLELAGGRALELNIRPGAIVRHRFFNNVDLPAEPASEDDAAEGVETERTE